jgi:hypothetical protein
MSRIRTQRPNNQRDRRWPEVGLLDHQAPTSLSAPGEASQPESDSHQQQQVAAMGLADRHTSERTRR